jgi:LCP family protein required for cell wall assembly
MPSASQDPPVGGPGVPSRSRRRRRSGPNRRPTRRRRLWAWTAAAVAALLLAGAATAAAVYEKLSGNIKTADLSAKLGKHRPADPTGRDMNILVIGSDSRAGTGRRYGAQFTTAQSDTLLLLHLPANRRWAAVVSIPRDSWVTIPPCELGNGRLSARHQFKINEAFTLGSDHGDQAGGAACAITTVEAATHIHIDHFVIVDFQGFKAMTAAVGGVPVCLPKAVNDPKSHLDLPAGRSLVSGEQALAFVRERYLLGDGSDLGRISRQQQFMSAMAQRAKSKLYDPPAIYRFLDAATGSVTTDPALGNLRALYRLVTSVRNLPTRAVAFITVPSFPRQRVVPGDHANLLWREPAAATLFSALARDVDPTAAGGLKASAASPTATATAVAGRSVASAPGAGQAVCSGS